MHWETIELAKTNACGELIIEMKRNGIVCKRKAQRNCGARLIEVVFK